MTGSSVAEPAPRIRDLAAARATALGLPTSALEDWRYVRLDTLREAVYAAPRAVTTDELRAHVDHTQRALVVVDGRFHSLGHGDWPANWKLTLPDAAHDAALAQSLANESDAARVWAYRDGECRQIVRISGHHPEPLHVVDVVSGGTSGWALDLQIAPGAEVDVIVRHIALGAARSCPALHVSAGRGARVRVEQFQIGAHHHLLPSASIELAADATVQWTSVVSGGACVRLATQARISGPGAHLALAGATHTRDTAQAHHLIRLTHAAGNSTSEQLFKSVLSDRSRTSFDGLVHITAGSDGTDAKQHNRNLLLSDLATADTRPQLDIRADDVKAAHGATVGQLDADEQLYLRMRGLSADSARQLLTAGFSGEVLDTLRYREFAP
jgi:Fe-S cluster assembly protein SufD